jgi:hypothetical protein
LKEYSFWIQRPNQPLVGTQGQRIIHMEWKCTKKVDLGNGYENLTG